MDIIDYDTCENYEDKDSADDGGMFHRWNNSTTNTEIMLGSLRCAARQPHVSSKLDGLSFPVENI
jgi:hypothetical protein